MQCPFSAECCMLCFQTLTIPQRLFMQGVTGVALFFLSCHNLSVQRTRYVIVCELCRGIPVSIVYASYLCRGQVRQCKQAICVDNVRQCKKAICVAEDKVRQWMRGGQLSILIYPPSLRCNHIVAVCWLLLLHTGIIWIIWPPPTHR